MFLNQYFLRSRLIVYTLFAFGITTPFSPEIPRPAAPRAEMPRPALSHRAKRDCTEYIALYIFTQTVDTLDLSVGAEKHDALSELNSILEDLRSGNYQPPLTLTHPSMTTYGLTQRDGLYSILHTFFSALPNTPIMNLRLTHHLERHIRRLTSAASLAHMQQTAHERFERLTALRTIYATHAHQNEFLPEHAVPNLDR